MAENDEIPRPNDIYVEFLIKEDSSLSVLINLFNAIYTTSEISANWLKSTFMALLKKLGATYSKALVSKA